MMKERCSCGFPIPRGYGYYNWEQEVTCINCNKKNKRKHRETIEEFGEKLKEILNKK